MLTAAVRTEKSACAIMRCFSVLVACLALTVLHGVAGEEREAKVHSYERVKETLDVKEDRDVHEGAGASPVKQSSEGDGLPQWRVGRGTFYGDEHWLWSIHEGSCGFGEIWEDEPLGWDVAAIPDVHYEYAGSCGTCYEVACSQMAFTDNYGNHLDRQNVCKDPTQSVVVRITDTCPCNYATNAYSNKRWCCGDMDHFDLSIWAFEKLADRKWGVIGLKYRPVPCDYVPPNPAPKPENPHQAPGPSKPRPWWLPKVSEETSTTPEDSASNEADNPHDLPEVHTPLPTTQPAESKALYAGGIQSNWNTKQWNAKRVYGWKGPSGNDAFCGEVHGYGALGFESHGGDFSNRVSLEMWFRTDDGVPDVRLQLTGHKECGMLNLKELQPTGEKVNGYERYLIYLGLFDFGAHEKRVVAFASDFRGCGGNSAGDVKNLYIRNDSGRQQFVCMDNVKLL